MKITALILLGIVVAAYTTLYFIQEKLLFIPTPLSKQHNFEFPQPFKEVNISAKDGIQLNCLHFNSLQAKGIIIYFHGNAGNLASWGFEASLYTQLNYDVFFVDYRSYGKSEGKIKSEEQLFSDAQSIFDYVKQQFREDEIIISGTSIGTGIATKIASQNQPKALLLHSPYSSLIKLVREKIAIVPSFLIKYKLNTLKNMQDVKCPIVIFHGRNDQLIPIHHSLLLKEKFPHLQLHILENTGHNDISAGIEYKQLLAKALL